MLVASSSAPPSLRLECTVKTHIKSDHRLIMWKLRLKLNARCRRAQRYHTHKVDPCFLEDQQVLEFRMKMGEGLAAGPKGARRNNRAG